GRIAQLHLERRPLVFLDAHACHRVAERALHAPRPERPARRDRELAGRRAEAVRRDDPLLDFLVVLVVEADRDGGGRIDLEAAAAGVAAVSEDLPENALLRAIDAAIGEDERGRRLLGLRRSIPVVAVAVESQVGAPAAEDEPVWPLLLFGQLEDRHALRVRRPGADPDDPLRIPL